MRTCAECKYHTVSKHGEHYCDHKSSRVTGSDTYVTGVYTLYTCNAARGGRIDLCGKDGQYWEPIPLTLKERCKYYLTRKYPVRFSKQDVTFEKVNAMKSITPKE